MPLENSKKEIYNSNIMNMKNSQTNTPIRVLVIGCGNMGSSHALAYHNMAAFEICGLVSSGHSKDALNTQLGGQYKTFTNVDEAFETTRPQAVCISTYPDTHEQYILQALEKNCHVFVEKPIADTLEGALRVQRAVERSGKKLVVGYILRHHPSWIRFVEEARQLGTPLVMRMNLNQQSQGKTWKTHKSLMKTISPIVDCGVHYIDVMCQMSAGRPQKVSAIGARLTDELAPSAYNYGQLQIQFSDGSVGWYEAGWGPMISENAYFIKDVIGPKGAVSILAKNAQAQGNSDTVEAHTQTEQLLLHHAQLDEKGQFALRDEWINTQDEPDHHALCRREQEYFLKTILENLDLTKATEDAINSLRIALACDESIRTGCMVDLSENN